jgi:hypothetical protein
MKEIVRRSDQKRSELPSLEHLLKATAGIWKGTDGLTYQASIRSEWDKETRPQS